MVLKTLLRKTHYIRIERNSFHSKTKQRLTAESYGAAFFIAFQPVILDLKNVAISSSGIWTPHFSGKRAFILP